MAAARPKILRDLERQHYVDVGVGGRGLPASELAVDAVVVADQGVVAVVRARAKLPAIPAGNRLLEIGIFGALSCNGLNLHVCYLASRPLL